MRLPFFLIILVGAVVFFSGCSQPQSPGVSMTATVTTLATPAPTTTTIPPVTATTTPADPVIGTWVIYIYPSWGKTKTVITCFEDHTWTRNISQFKSQKTEYGHGSWITQGAARYDLKSSLGNSRIFEYDRTSDTLVDTTNPDLLRYRRSTDGTDPFPLTRIEDEENIPTLNITVHSARRVSSIGGSHPLPGNIYLVVNITVKNLNETGLYMFSDENIRAVPDGGTGSSSLNRKSGDFLENAFPAGKITVGEERQGNVIFGVPEQSESFTLKLFNGLGETVSNVVELKNVPVSDE
jgi:hypothetical protein